MEDRLVVGMTGATGKLFGITALEILAEQDSIESHLVLSDASKINIQHECSRQVSEVTALADHVHNNKDIGAAIASGSFNTRGMLITPCSMKTLSNIAHGNSGNLITRAADVTLKERRPLVVMPREKPFNRIHLKNMLEVTDAGGIILPPLPSFYQHPDSIQDMVTRTMIRALNQFDFGLDYDEWQGVSSVSDPTPMSDKEL
jgi:4-hydroxy-3-polyprenylbenzoate decarboxylase